MSPFRQMSAQRYKNTTKHSGVAGKHQFSSLCYINNGIKNDWRL